jgi:rod shape determining protein RodA
VLLVFVLLPFLPRWIVEPRNGARSWINLYLMAFQPSELAKIVFVLALARYLRFRENYRTLGGLLVPFAIMFVPVGLILKQPDLGTALLFAPALFAMLLAAGAKMRHLLTLLVLVVAVGGVTVTAIDRNWAIADMVLKGHQQDRIKSMISLVRGDRRYEKTIAYQQTKAMDLVGSGQLAGYGKERAQTIVRFNRLPEAHNDMIFAVVVNRWGFVGGAATLLSYLLLLLSFVLVAARTKDPFMRLTTVGFGGMIFSQAVLNIAMAIGLMPITGITLPFISYGGSSLATTFVMIGLVVNFASRRQAIVARPSFEFDNADVIYQ